MRTFYPVNASLPAAEALLSAAGSARTQPGLDGPGFPASSRTVRGGAGGGRPPFRLRQMRKFPPIEPLSRSGAGERPQGGFRAGGTPSFAREEELESESSDPETEAGRSHFLFEEKNARPDRSRTGIPPLPRLYRAPRPGNLPPLGRSRELPPRRAGRPFTLGCAEPLELTPPPTFLLPPAFVLNGRSSVSVESCRLSRPRVSYPAFTLLTVKERQKAPSYEDPMVGASRSFVHRISELSSLEGETVRQEKLQKMKKAQKPPS